MDFELKRHADVQPKQEKEDGIFDWRLANAVAEFRAHDFLNQSLGSKSERLKEIQLKQSEKMRSVSEILQSFNGVPLKNLEEAVELLNKDLEGVSESIRLEERVSERIRTPKDRSHLDELYAEMDQINATIDFLRSGWEATFRDSRFVSIQKEKQEAVQREEEQENQREVANVREQIERRFIEEIVNKGGAVCMTSFPKAYGPKGNAGFAPAIDSSRIDSGTKTDLLAEGSRFKSQEKMFDQEDIHEAIALEPLTVATYPKVEVPVEKKGLFGTKTVMELQTRVQKTGVRMNEVIAGGDDELAFRLLYHTFDNHRNGKSPRYQDYSGRKGQELSVSLALPESMAKSLAAEIQNNPGIVRKIVKEIMIRKTKVPEAAWEEGDAETHGVPMKPPYEAWKEDAGGKQVIYFEGMDGGKKLEI